ncbi:MAG TPA: MBL fold metallo-hydrolase, partial [Propionibacteriaceae bacterium]|nr:MBL fold metallo-hydrolase [Propionibacteriaceae bacterium]
MKLTIVGCSGSLSGPDSPASSYLVQAPYQDRTFSLLLDFGPGAMGALYRYLDPRELDAMALSHLHADHCLDLCGYYVAACYSPSAPWPRRPVYGPSNAAMRIAQAYEVPYSTGAVSEHGPSVAKHFDWRLWQPSQRIGPFTVRTVRVAHPVEAYAIRVEEDVPGGGAMVYSGDTGPTEALVQLAHGVDLLLVESAFLDQPGNPDGMHLSGPQAAGTGQAAGVGAVVLTHIPPWYEPDRVLAQASPHFDGPISLAKPGAVWDVVGRLG